MKQADPESAASVLALLALALTLLVLGMGMVLLLLRAWRRHQQRIRPGPRAAHPETDDPWAVSAQRAKAEDADDENA